MTTETRILVTGMFRSGTTLLARLLNAHSNIFFASDPFARVFKAFRYVSAHSEMARHGITPDAPLGNYFLTPNEIDVFDAVQRSDFTLATTDVDITALRENVAQSSEQFSPLIRPHLQLLNGSTFLELFESCFRILKHAYGKPGATATGFKEVWVGEFGSHFLSAFPGAKLIHIVRDPRAVCASNLATREKYPLLFLIRQWRKLAFFAWRDEQMHKGRALVIKYEDLVLQPQATLNKICAFLEVDYQANLLDPSQYLDGNGSPWRQNSSHFTGEQRFNPKSVDAWQTKNDAELSKCIEALCQGEMRTFGYIPPSVQYKPLDLDNVLSPCVYEKHELAEWIRPFSNTNVGHNIYEMSAEKLRIQLLLTGAPLSLAQAKAFFFDQAFYRRIAQ